MRFRDAMILGLLCGCATREKPKGSRDEGVAAQTTQHPSGTEPVGSTSASPVGSTPASPVASLSGTPASAKVGPAYHLDTFPTKPAPPARKHRDTFREVRLMLRSSPPGATAFIDGKEVGVTPMHWRGRVNDRPTHVTFTLAGYAARYYRFVPVTDGVVHAKLKPALQPDSVDKSAGHDSTGTGARVD